MSFDFSLSPKYKNTYLYVSKTMLRGWYICVPKKKTKATQTSALHCTVRGTAAAPAAVGTYTLQVSDRILRRRASAARQSGPGFRYLATGFWSVWVVVSDILSSRQGRTGQLGRQPDRWRSMYTPPAAPPVPAEPRHVHGAFSLVTNSTCTCTC